MNIDSSFSVATWMGSFPVRSSFTVTILGGIEMKQDIGKIPLHHKDKVHIKDKNLTCGAHLINETVVSSAAEWLRARKSGL